MLNAGRRARDPASAKRVMDVVQERPAEPYDAARLAEMAQVSVRTLQDAFRKHVRVQLQTSAPGTTTVPGVAWQLRAAA